MSKYLMGDFIRETRLRKGYTQEEVSFGICTPASLSRIENGVQTPGKHVLDALLQRLGIENSVFDVFVDKEEMEIYEELQAVTRSIAVGEYKELENQVSRLENLLENSSKIQKQYLVFAKGVLEKGKGYSSELVMQRFMNAINMTLPEFDGMTPMHTNLLTFNEITIINNIAIMHATEGRIDVALRLEYWIKEYMEKHLIDGKEKNAKYPMVLYNMSCWLGQERRYEEVKIIIEEGIEYCIKFGNLVAFPLLLFNKGCVLAETGNEVEAKKFFKQSTVIFEAMRQETRVKQTVDLCKKLYGIQIDV